MDFNRDLFISEETINYLQSSYQNIYSDTAIIKNYIRYKELLLKQETAKNYNKKDTDKFKIVFTDEDEEELETLNRYFFGNSDGSSSGSGNSLAYRYLATIDTIKKMIAENDNSIKNIVVDLSSLVSDTSMPDEAYNRYLNELIIPGIIGNIGISSTKSSNEIEANKIIKNVLSKEKQNEFIIQKEKEQAEKEAREQKLKLQEEQNKEELIKQKTKTEQEEIKRKELRETERKKREEKNKEILEKDNKKIFETKLNKIEEDVDAKISEINIIIKNNIYQKSIYSLFRDKSDKDEKITQLNEDGNFSKKIYDKYNKKSYQELFEDKKRLKIKLGDVGLAYNAHIKTEGNGASLLEIYGKNKKKNKEEYERKIKKFIEENKQTEAEEKTEENKTEENKEDEKRDINIAELTLKNQYLIKRKFFLLFQKNSLENVLEIITALLSNKRSIIKGGGDKDTAEIIKNLPQTLIDISGNLKTNFNTLENDNDEFDEQQYELVLFYIRLFNLYIKPLKDKIKEIKENKNSKISSSDIPKDLLLLYDNFKNEYNDFIKKHKELSLQIQKNIEKSKKIDETTKKSETTEKKDVDEIDETTEEDKIKKLLILLIKTINTKAKNEQKMRDYDTEIIKLSKKITEIDDTKYTTLQDLVRTNEKTIKLYTSTISKTQQKIEEKTSNIQSLERKIEIIKANKDSDKDIENINKLIGQFQTMKGKGDREYNEKMTSIVDNLISQLSTILNKKYGIDNADKTKTSNDPLTLTLTTLEEIETINKDKIDLTNHLKKYNELLVAQQDELKINQKKLEEAKKEFKKAEKEVEEANKTLEKIRKEKEAVLKDNLKLISELYKNESELDKEILLEIDIVKKKYKNLSINLTFTKDDILKSLKEKIEALDEAKKEARKVNSTNKKDKINIAYDKITAYINLLASVSNDIIQEAVKTAIMEATTKKAHSNIEQDKVKKLEIEMKKDDKKDDNKDELTIKKQKLELLKKKELEAKNKEIIALKIAAYLTAAYSMSLNLLIDETETETEIEKIQLDLDTAENENNQEKKDELKKKLELKKKAKKYSDLIKREAKKYSYLIKREDIEKAEKEKIEAEKKVHEIETKKYISDTKISELKLYVSKFEKEKEDLIINKLDNEDDLSSIQSQLLILEENKETSNDTDISTDKINDLKKEIYELKQKIEKAKTNLKEDKNKLDEITKQLKTKKDELEKENKGNIKLTIDLEQAKENLRIAEENSKVIIDFISSNQNMSDFILNDEEISYDEEAPPSPAAPPTTGVQIPPPQPPAPQPPSPPPAASTTEASPAASTTISGPPAPQPPPSPTRPPSPQPPLEKENSPAPGMPNEQLPQELIKEIVDFCIGLFNLIKLTSEQLNIYYNLTDEQIIKIKKFLSSIKYLQLKDIILLIFILVEKLKSSTFKSTLQDILDEIFNKEYNKENYNRSLKKIFNKKNYNSSLNISLNISLNEINEILQHILNKNKNEIEIMLSDNTFNSLISKDTINNILALPAPPLVEEIPPPLPPTASGTLPAPLPAPPLPPTASETLPAPLPAPPLPPTAAETLPAISEEEYNLSKFIKPLETAITNTLDNDDNIETLKKELSNFLGKNNIPSPLQSEQEQEPSSNEEINGLSMEELENINLVNDNIGTTISEILKRNNITTGGNNNNIDIKKVYDLYYTTNSDNLIIELLEILKTSENVIYFMLIINKSISELLKDLNKLLIFFYKNDILLSHYYNENEIIYYIFINYIYNNFKSLLLLSGKDIIITIGKIKTKENYRQIYKKLDELLKNPDIISKLILFFKKYLKLPKEIIHPEKTKDVEYLLLFIYKYSKQEDKIIKGYDSFLTFIYLNILNKLNKTIRINNTTYKLDNLPTFNLYDFTKLKINFKIEMSSNQEQLSSKLMKEPKLLIEQISERYKYIENNKEITKNCNFKLNDEIFDYLNIFGNDEIFKNYKTMSIMDLYTLNKNNNIDIKNLKETKETKDIIYNILLLSSYIYKDNKEIPKEIYAKLVKHYFLTINNKKLNDFVYEMIFIMNKRINKSDIQKILIKELSEFNIELSDITKFINPEDKKLNIFELLKIINFLTYDYISLIIPYLYHFYINDNKLQYTIQDLLCKKILATKKLKIMYGGEGETKELIVYNKTYELINNILSDAIINELKKFGYNIEKTSKGLPDLTKIDKEFEYSITFKHNSDGINIELNEYEKYTSQYLNDIINALITKPSELNKYVGLFNNKLKELEKFNNKLDEYKTFISNKQQIITDLYTSSFIELFKRISKEKDIQDYPNIKEIYDKYIINSDNGASILMHDTNEIFNLYNETLKKYDGMLNEIKVKVEELIVKLNSNKTGGKIKNNNKIINRINKINNNIKGGSSIKNIDEIKKKINALNDDNTKKMNDILRNFSKLKGNRDIDNNVEKRLATPGFIDKHGNNIFEKLMSSYEKDINDDKIPEEITKNLFYNKVYNHSLDPEEELQITLNDKLIFIVLIYCIRLGALLICYKLINNNMITDINKTLFYYILVYYAIFALILILINIDTFKMRILVNYMNLHVSTTNIWMHLILMGCFIYLIYLLVINILGDEKPPTELGDHEKIKLKYKLDLLTIIIFIFICILIFII